MEDLNVKRLEFYKNRIMSRLETLKPMMPDVKYRLYCKLLDDCSDYTDIREMSELDLQFELADYVKSIRAKLEETDTTLEELKVASNSKATRQVAVVIKRKPDSLDINTVKKYMSDDKYTDVIDNEIGRRIDTEDERAENEKKAIDEYYNKQALDNIQNYLANIGSNHVDSSDTDEEEYIDADDVEDYLNEYESSSGDYEIDLDSEYNPNNSAYGDSVATVFNKSYIEMGDNETVYDEEEYYEEVTEVESDSEALESYFDTIENSDEDEEYVEEDGSNTDEEMYNYLEGIDDTSDDEYYADEDENEVTEVDDIESILGSESDNDEPEYIDIDDVDLLSEEDINSDSIDSLLIDDDTEEDEYYLDADADDIESSINELDIDSILGSDDSEDEEEEDSDEEESLEDEIEQSLSLLEDSEEDDDTEEYIDESDVDNSEYIKNRLDSLSDILNDDTDDEDDDVYFDESSSKKDIDEKEFDKLFSNEVTSNSNKNNYSSEKVKRSGVFDDGTKRGEQTQRMFNIISNLFTGTSKNTKVISKKVGKGISKGASTVINKANSSSFFDISKEEE